MFEEILTQFTNGNRGMAYDQWNELDPEQKRGFILFMKDLERSDVLANFILRMMAEDK
jgi:hypothetical protein